MNLWGDVFSYLSSFGCVSCYYVLQPRGCDFVYSIGITGRLKVLENSHEWYWAKWTERVGFHLCGYLLCHFSNILRDWSVVFRWSIRRMVYAIIGCLLESVLTGWAASNFSCQRRMWHFRQCNVALFGWGREFDPDDLDFKVFRRMALSEDDGDRWACVRLSHDSAKLSGCFQSLQKQRLWQERLTVELLSDV